jgi:hypothetical protein
MKKGWHRILRIASFDGFAKSQFYSLCEHFTHFVSILGALEIFSGTQCRSQKTFYDSIGFGGIKKKVDESISDKSGQFQKLLARVSKHGLFQKPKILQILVIAGETTSHTSIGLF